LRVEEDTVILAIYGASCSGKTTLSTTLSRQFSFAVRHCGEIVKASATKRQVPPADLSLEDHLAIDHETRRAAVENPNLIIEGCFLNLVLAESASILIELRCDREVRDERYRERNSSIAFQARDDGDLKLRTNLYSEIPGRPPNLSIDTTHLKTEETAMEVTRWLLAQGLFA
jgi:cytidylate kinase